MCSRGRIQDPPLHGDPLSFVLIQDLLDLADLFNGLFAEIVGALALAVGIDDVGIPVDAAQQVLGRDIRLHEGLILLAANLVGNYTHTLDAQVVCQTLHIAVGLHAACTGLDDHDELIHTLGSSATQMLQTGLHIHDDHIVFAIGQCGEDGLEHHMLGTHTTRAAHIHRAHDQELDAVDGLGIQLGDVSHIGVELVELIVVGSAGALLGKALNHHSCVKSVGNSTTPPHDLTTMDDARCIYYLLAESVAARLRKGGFRAKCISISARTTDLVTRSHQLTLRRCTNLTDELARAAMALFTERFARGFPYRSVGLSCSMLSSDDEPVQLDFMGSETRRIHLEQLEKSIDSLRGRYGHQIIQRGVVLQDHGYAQINPVEEHTVHPVPMFTG